VSRRSSAPENPLTISRSRASSSSRSVCCWVRAGTFSATTARARCRALFTEARDVRIIAAISAAEKPRTSNSSSAARWLPGRC
jgi:hypothetical protein